MKCKNCGGNLTLEDVVCPHCEAINEHAIEHIREMNRYKTDYEGTKQEVISTTKAYAGIAIRIIILAVLIVLTIICGMLSGETYSIKRDITEAFRNDEKCKAQIEEYLESRDYYALAVYCDNNEIRTSTEGYEEYKGVVYGALQYAYFYDYVMKAASTSDESKIQSYAEWMSEQLNSFYRMLDETDFYCYVDEANEYYKSILEMEEQMHALLITYCNLTQVEADELRNMSKAEITLLLQEGLADE